MAESSFRRFYRPSDFVALVGDLDMGMLRTVLTGLGLSAPIGNVEKLATGLGVRIEWDDLPPPADVALIDAAVAAFTGGATTSQPFVYESFALATSSSGTPVVKIDQTTPPLDAGTYQVSWVCNTQMAAVIANTGVQATIRLERLPDNAFVEQPDAWDRAAPHAFNGSQPFPVQAGKRIRALLTFVRLGASGQAEMRGARITIDKVGELAG
jgi:hypothetical protein